MKRINRVTRRVRSRDGKRTVHLDFERFEDRFLLATVTTTADNVGSPPPGSLRAAILSGDATIDFAIPGSAPFVISPAGSLPPIDHPVLLDGTTQAGYVGVPIIRINGNTNNHGGNGLVLDEGSNGSSFRGLNVFGFAHGGGFRVQSANNAIQNNSLGTNAAGTNAGPGNQLGLLVSGSNNTIGGLAASVTNVIAFNTSDGVRVDTGTGNVIRENSIFQNSG